MPKCSNQLQAMESSLVRDRRSTTNNTNDISSAPSTVDQDVTGAVQASFWGRNNEKFRENRAWKMA